MDSVDRPRFEYGEPIGPEDSFYSPGDAELDPAPIARVLIAEEDGFTELREGEATILFLMRAEPDVKAGRANLGKMCLPTFSGALGGVGKWMLARMCDGVPDFVMLLDAVWWDQAPAEQRRALVYHELLHAMHATDRDGGLKFTPEGKPVWAIRDHDISEFNAVVRRFGAWSPDVQSFVSALRDGGAV